MNPIFVEEIDCEWKMQEEDHKVWIKHCFQAMFVGMQKLSLVTQTKRERKREIVDELVKLLLKWNPHVYVNLLNFLKFNYKKVMLIL